MFFFQKEAIKNEENMQSFWNEWSRVEVSFDISDTPGWLAHKNKEPNARRADAMVGILTEKICKKY